MDVRPCEERALVHFMMHHAAGPIVVIDAAGAIVEMNRAARRRAGELGALFEPEGTDRVLERFLRALEAVGATAETEHLSTDADGTTRHLALSGANMHGWRVIGVEDLTARRALERELDALRRIESLGMLTASLVHDLNNLLTPVLCLSGVALRAVAGTPIEPQLQDLQASASRASSLVRDMLALGRPRVPVAQPVDVNEVLSQLAPVAERLLGERCVLTLTLEDGLPPVALERSRFELALLNLVANARDASPPGGCVAITTSLGRTGRTPSRSGATHVIVAVTDHGSGMSEQVRVRVFERSFTTKPMGTGLGLASVHAFVRDSDGAVSVESAPGRGTTVVMELPVERRARARAASGSLPTQPGASGVLVVDPDASVRGAARAALEARGLYVVEAGTLEATLALAQTLAVDVALVDLTLAREDPRFTERLEAAAPRLRIVWMTGDLESHSPGPILRKAFSEHDLVGAVLDVLIDRSA